MAPKRRAEGAGCVFLRKTRRGVDEMRGAVNEGEGRVEREREAEGTERREKE